MNKIKEKKKNKNDTLLPKTKSNIKRKNKKQASKQLAVCLFLKL